MKGLIFTLIGPDRPGIVDMVAQCIARHDGSWEESQLVRLNGQFAGIVHAVVPDARRDALAGALADLPDLQTVVTDAVDEDDGSETVHLDLIGADRPGIIHQIGRVLAERGVNLVQMDTSTERAAMSGEPMFRVRAQLAVPEGLSIQDLRAPLEAIANELMVELTLEEPSAE